MEHNRTGVDFRLPLPRPKVRGAVIDFHVHLLAARHARLFFEVADHFGIDAFVSMTPLEEALGIQRMFGPRVQFIAIPRWGDVSSDWPEQWLRRIDAFHNLGSRIVKFHLAPGTMHRWKLSLEHPQIRRIMRHAAERGMILMTHVGDPDTWYRGRYADASVYGTREQHYASWESALSEYRTHPWLGAHLGGNPEDLPRLQRLLDRFPNLYLDLSATKWIVREVSARRDAAREFILRNVDRLLWGTDQVTSDDRGFDFLASRFWCHRKLWETAYQGPSPIHDPDLPDDQQPVMRGLALPDEALQKLYHDNALALLKRVGVSLDLPAQRLSA